MLEITILKTHRIEDDRSRSATPSSKILSYIQSCDIFAMEQAAITEENALYLENAWKHLLAQDMSLDELNRRFISKAPNTDLYNKWVFEQAYSDRKPLYFLERFREHEAARVIRLHHEGLQLKRKGLEFIRRKMNGAETAYSGVEMQVQSAVLRDKEMAKNVREQEMILGAYPALRRNDVVRICVEVGVQQRPEDLIRGYDRKPIYLVGEPDAAEALSEDIFQSVRSGAKLVDVKERLEKLALITTL